MPLQILFAVVLATVSAAPTLPPMDSAGSSEISAPSSRPTTSEDRFSSSSTIGSTSPIARPPASSAKALISDIRTPASTAKLTQWVAPPLVSPIAAAPILSPIQVSPYAYAVPALGSLELAAAPSTYSIEQHGYRIIY
ncbi:pectinesterase inhibitor 10-like [Osmia bicornis bicornis]|uniref:pectinesterase inhibitor 10-like n=1 Tax=Osmia bicornis bicornis TaxID=1437191 RepID=UPI001EAEBC87|nr:pectinesterase inhibitor 10-like [Osmia bicornis bicornis]